MSDPTLVAQRLRLVLVKCGEDSNSRRNSVQAALEDETKSMMADERNRFLDMVARHFPVWRDVANSDAIPDNNVAAAREVKDPKSLAAALGELFPRLSANQQNEVRQLLMRAGVLPSATAIQEQRIREVVGRFRRQAQGGPKDTNLASLRLMEVFCMMAEQIITTEEFVSPCWRNYRNEGTGPAIRELIGRYLCSSDEEPVFAKVKVELQEQLAGLRNRIVTWLSGIPAFARRFAQTRCPSAIEEGVGGKWGMMPGKYKDVWNRYVELCGGREQEQFEDQIVTTVRQIIKDL